MRDLFDDFMDELRRREAEARGEDPDAVAPRRRRPSEPAPEPDGDGDGDGDGSDDHDPDGDGPDETDASGSGRQPPRPIRGRKPGGPNDGGGFGSRVRRAGRALGIGLAALILLALIALFAFGIEIWTDALWFQSVGYSDVYWTRISAQVGLFVFGLVLALIVLLGNLWLAGRLTDNVPDRHVDRRGGADLGAGAAEADIRPCRAGQRLDAARVRANEGGRDPLVDVGVDRGTAEPALAKPDQALVGMDANPDQRRTRGEAYCLDLGDLHRSPNAAHPRQAERS